MDDDSPPATVLSLALTTSYITANLATTCGGITIATVPSITTPPQIPFRSLTLSGSACPLRPTTTTTSTPTSNL